MARVKSPTRVNEIADSALAAFSQVGFKNAQMGDIARSAGVSAGTVYLYFDSKEALFSAALLRSLGRDLSFESAAPLPLENLELLADTLKIAPDYYEALADLDPLERVLSLLWRELSRVGPAVRLIERCRDWPELAEAFFGRSRTQFIERLTNYLKAGAEAKVVRPLESPAISARLIIETMAWFTMHRLGDHDGKNIPEATARETTLDALYHAFRFPQGELLCQS